MFLLNCIIQLEWVSFGCRRQLGADYLDEQAKLPRLRRSVGFRIELVMIEYGKDESGFLLTIDRKTRGG